MPKISKREFQVNKEKQVRQNTDTTAAKDIKRKQNQMQWARCRNDGNINNFLFNTLPVPNKPISRTPTLFSVCVLQD